MLYTEKAKQKEGESKLSGVDFHSPHCYGCGLENPNGLRADFTFDESIGEVRFTYKAYSFQCSINGILHGGVLAALLDEAQGALCGHLGFMVMTDKLEVKYHKASLLKDSFIICAWLTTARKRRLYTKASLHNEQGELLVESKAIFYILPERLWKRIWSTTEEDIEYTRNTLQSNRKRAARIRKRLRSNPPVPEG